jgi:ankyrin repeat protein
MRLLHSPFFRSPKYRRTAILLIALVTLVCCSPAFCGQIHEAAKSGDLGKVKSLVKGNPAVVFSTDTVGYTPLHWAAFEGYEEVAEFLLVSKATVNARSVVSGGSRPRQTQVPLDRGHGVAIQMVDISGLTPLHLAAQMGHKDGTELLLAHKADVNAKDSTHSTPLHKAANSGVKSVVELLLAKKADPNAKDITDSTPLHVAAYSGHSDVVDLLLASGAEVNVKSKQGLTPLYLAVMQGHKEAIGMLLAGGADVNAKSPQGWTPLRFATLTQRRDMAEYLREHGGHE